MPSASPRCRAKARSLEVCSFSAFPIHSMYTLFGSRVPLQRSLSPMSLLRFSIEWRRVSYRLPMPPLSRSTPLRSLPTLSTVCAVEFVVSVFYNPLWHPVARLPTSLLSWGFAPFSVSVAMRPFFKDRSLRLSNSSCSAFPPLKFLTSLTGFSASRSFGFFHPIPLLGFVLQRFSPPTSRSTSRHPSPPNVPPKCSFPGSSSSR